MGTELYMNDAATWRKAKELWYCDAGTWRAAKECWYNDASVWRNVYSSFALVTGNTYNSEMTDTLSPSVRFNTDGTVDVRINGGSFIAGGNWGSPATTGIGSSYWIFMTLGATANGSTMTGAATGSWIQLSALQTWSIAAAPGAGAVRDRSLSYVIAASSGGATLASGNVNLVSDRS
jgi:hypothetical protein